MQHTDHAILASLDRIDQIVLDFLRYQGFGQLRHLGIEPDPILDSGILLTKHILIIGYQFP